ncbi:hypothetical protein ACFX1R_046041 [Malus domestica]
MPRRQMSRLPWRKLFFGETFGAPECDRDGVAEDHLDGGGGDRSQIKGQSSRSTDRCTFMSQREARALTSTEVTKMKKAPLALAQGTRRMSSSVVPVSSGVVQICSWVRSENAARVKVLS